MARATAHKKGVFDNMESVNYMVAGAAISSPLWLKDIGNVAGEILPLLGVVWLVVQIAHKLYTWPKSDKEKV